VLFASELLLDLEGAGLVSHRDEDKEGTVTHAATMLALPTESQFNVFQSRIDETNLPTRTYIRSDKVN
jgi:hypothetical protein